MRRLISSASDSATLAFLRWPYASGSPYFVHLVALPLGAPAEHNQRVIARICALLLDEQLDEFVEIDLVFGDDTADRGDVRGVERCKIGIAAEDAENADPLVRADGGPLALDVRGAFFLSVRAYIYIVRQRYRPHFCARSSFNQHRNERGCLGTDAPKRR